MRCCVPFCKNCSDNLSTSEKSGITFHRLPSEQNLRAAWLRALGTQDHQLSDPAVVCSQHFLDDDFYKTKSCVKQIRSNAIPSTVQVCMICLDTDSRQVLMSKHKLKEAYEQVTGLSLHHRGNLKQTLCVLCAQRLINFSRFRDLCLSAHSLMTDLLEKHESITTQHKKLLKYTTKDLQCNLTLVTLGANHCDLYIKYTDEDSRQQTAEESVVVKNECSTEFNADNMDLAQEDKKDLERLNNDCVPEEYCNMKIKLEPMPVDEGMNTALQYQAAAEKSVVGDATVVVKNEGSSDSNADYMELAQEDENDIERSNNNCVPDKYSNVNIKLEPKPVDEPASDDAHRMAETEIQIKCETVTFQCTHCFGEFVTQNAYQEHMSVHLQSAACESSQVCEPRAAESCSWDSLVLDNNPLLVFHRTESQRLNDGPPPSVDCAPAIVSPMSARLAAKNEKNAVEKPYSCDTCDYKCKQKSDLAKHKRTHTGEKPYSCEICDYKFAHKSHLLVHNRIHTGEKPYSCDTCDYKCVQKSDLSKHKKTHTGEKPFSCDICNYKCARKNMLLVHKSTHTGEKPYSCDICDYSCVQKSDLSKHKRTHTGEKPYSCDLCHYKTADKRNLLRHRRTQHTDEKQ